MLQTCDICGKVYDSESLGDVGTDYTKTYNQPIRHRCLECFSKYVKNDYTDSASHSFI